MHIKHNPEVQALVSAVDSGVHKQVTDLSQVMEALEVKALAKMNALLDGGSTQKIQLEAAKDLLDRGQRTSKVQKVQSTSFHMTASEALEIASAVNQAREAREKFTSEVVGGYDRIDRTGTEG
jgi:acetyl-CoA carboxylase beta subunit